MLKTEYDAKLLTSILNKIKKKAIQGDPYLVYSYNTFIYSQRKINSVKEILKKKGFYISEWNKSLFYGQLYISWHF